MKLYFVEHLNLRSWFLVILPQLMSDKIRKSPVADHCYVFETSSFALSVARFFGRFLGMRLEPLEYRLIDVVDESGLLVRLRVAHQDLAEIQADAMQEPVVQRAGDLDPSSPRLLTYIAKRIGTIHFFNRMTIYRAALLIQISLWKARQWSNPEPEACVFLERRFFNAAIVRYARRYHASVIPVRPAIRVVTSALSLLGPTGTAFVRRMRDLWYERTLGLRRVRSHSESPLVATDYQGQLNLNDPASFTDLFFWQQSSLPGRNVVITFGIPQDPLDQKKAAELAEHGITAVIVHPKAAILSSIPFFSHMPDLRRRFPRLSIKNAPVASDARWVRTQVESYYVERNYWIDLFSRQNIKVYVTWYRYDERHCAIADALQSLGGITAVYQRAWQPNPSAESTVNADVMFGYSRSDAEMERLSGSVISYHVAVGFLGDHRFPLLTDRAKTVRQLLVQKGAQFVVAFFDENSHDNEKLLLGHSVTRENYQFLLEKLLENPWLGLVIKPKAPQSLRRRLGAVGELLDRAEATGRCYVFREGTLKSAIPPALASLASDLAIHGHVAAATAGFEAALTGVPTLLIDREGWPLSPLNQLGLGKVVFTNWQDCWSAMTEYRKHRTAGFGDWSPLMHQFDPFRDGRAAERMGTYIQWLIEGFEAGQNRETIMANAAERYAALWGNDKITSVGVERAALQVS